ncbi:hypothetical protein HLH34_15340 [Gluconacetobacter azotocaptans]|uniref:Uncharacterized protein n=1 Tax=Gluconacetobacter azotocaptans TaxID=142834 RepID=A0A7W4JV04_9PROT|nr:hypothetical protein [Gluconacetobacter azotocaptans]MBB2191315.1 hypothetical protein [Gluconacetobacter azotocaptans]GBQ33280.1 hypothetical protein AA13594_2580 [Gluconacetobacter azotocaptans DSM 13594]
MKMRAVIAGLSLWAPAPAVAQYAPFHPPGGLAAATVVGGQTLAQMQAATSAAQATASAAVPTVTIGQGGGVAGLDSGGRVTAPVSGDVTAAAVTPAGGAATMLGAYLGTVALTSDLAAYLTLTAAAQTYATKTALATTEATANAAVPSADIGQPSGVAGLNAAGQVTAPVVGDVTNAVATPAGGAQVTIGAALASYAAQAGLVAETSRAEGAEATLQGNITAEATTRANADALLFPLTGGEIEGTIIQSLPAGNWRSWWIDSTGAASPARWEWGATAFPETGSNAGSDFYFTAHHDDGTVHEVYIISRDTSIMTFDMSPRAPTPVISDNSQSLVTTAFVRSALASAVTYATLPAQGAFVGQRVFCSDCKSTVTAQLTGVTPAGHGIAATWDGAEWTDGLGYTVTH